MQSVSTKGILKIILVTKTQKQGISYGTFLLYLYSDIQRASSN